MSAPPAASGVADFPHYKRNIALLFVCWALTSTSMMLLITVSALVGASLAENKALLALPIAIQWYASAFFTIPPPSSWRGSAGATASCWP